MRQLNAMVVIMAMAATACADDAAVSRPMNEFVILGSAAGPDSQPDRAQPANVLRVNDDLYFVDAGDGAVGQLVKAGFRLVHVDGLFISHNHFDHTGGVLAILGLRRQLQATQTLQIFGPPGTQEFINGLLAGMAPAMEAGYGMPGFSWRPNVAVQEVVHGDEILLDGVTVLVAENSHFAIPEDSGVPEKAKALSFRFDLEDRTIVYTGDTGPSEAVKELAIGADLLISEMMDVDAVVEQIRADNPNIPEEQIAGVEWHLRAHHLLPPQVGELAAGAGVGKLIVTHMSPNVNTAEMAERYIGEIAAEYDGEIVIADDLDRF